MTLGERKIRLAVRCDNKDSKRFVIGLLTVKHRWRRLGLGVESFVLIAKNRDAKHILFDNRQHFSS